MIFIVSHDFNPIFLVFENLKNSDGIFGQQYLKKIIFIFFEGGDYLSIPCTGGGLGDR